MLSIDKLKTMDQIQTIDQGRRKLVLAGGCSAAAAGLGHINAVMAAEADKYGIRGQSAPEVTLDYWIDGDGKKTTFSVKQSEGKWVFLKYFQNWCPGCHSSGFPTLKAFCDAFYGHPKVEIAAVQTVFEGFHTNTQETVRELQLRYDIPATMGHDPGKPDEGIPSLTMINYRTGGTPWLVLIDPDGVVVFNNFHVDRNKLIDYVKSEIG